MSALGRIAVWVIASLLVPIVTVLAGVDAWDRGYLIGSINTLCMVWVIHGLAVPTPKPGDSNE